jgi:hypothetical protein
LVLGLHCGFRFCLGLSLDAGEVFRPGSPLGVIGGQALSRAAGPAEQFVKPGSLTAGVQVYGDAGL